MPILNYTTEIQAETSITEIQKMLVAHGASSIMADYNAAGQVTAISFKMTLKGQVIGFRLPSNAEKVLRVLERQKVEPRYRKIEHACRVSWRIIKDWVKAQMAIIEAEAVEMEEVFMPYMIMGNGKTLYEHAKQSNFLLGPPNN